MMKTTGTSVYEAKIRTRLIAHGAYLPAPLGAPVAKLFEKTGKSFCPSQGTVA